MSGIESGAEMKDRPDAHSGVAAAIIDLTTLTFRIAK
jgi:hypothetical protein